MKQRISRTGRRIWITLNYLSIILLLCSFYRGKIMGWKSLIIGGVILSLIVAVISFIQVQIRARLWKLIHLRNENLDEREIQVTRESLSISYSVFTIICLLILMAIFLFPDAMKAAEVLGMLLVGCLIYFAHTLPSSVIGWKEKEV